MLVSIQNEDVRYHIYGRSHERVISTTTQHTPPLLQVSAEAPRQPVSPTDCKSQRQKATRKIQAYLPHLPSPGSRRHLGPPPSCPPACLPNQGFWDGAMGQSGPTLVLNNAAPLPAHRPADGTPSHGRALCCSNTDMSPQEDLRHISQETGSHSSQSDTVLISTLTQHGNPHPDVTSTILGSPRITCAQPMPPWRALLGWQSLRSSTWQ